MSERPSQPKERKRVPLSIEQEIPEAGAASLEVPTSSQVQGKAGKSEAAEPRLEANKSGAEILASSGEEFRESLQTFRGVLDFLLAGQGPDARQANEFLAIADRETETLSSRVSDLQIASLIEVGGLRLEPTPVKMDQLLEDVVEQIAPWAADQGVTLEAKSLDNLPEIQGDEALLRMAITNTLQTGIRTASRQGSLTVRAAEREGWIIVGFSSREEAEALDDAPPGDEESNLALVDSWGLAVYVAEKILQAHNGRVWAKGTPDQIASLNLALPLRLKPREMDKVLVVDDSNLGLPVQSKPRGGNKVLIVEDSPETAHMVEYALEIKGYEALKTLNGAEALDLAKSENVDLVILDVMLPGVDGFEVCHRLRSDPETASIPVIMFSAKTSDEDIATAKRIGANAYIGKPFAMSELMEAVQDLLEDSENYPWRETYGDASEK